MRKVVTTFPADFMLVATANPCPCGYRSDPRRNCNCTPPQIEKYMSRISGPLLDRIDIHLEVPAVPFDELADNTSQGTSSDAMRQDVMRARDQQATRFHNQSTLYNAQMTSRQVRSHCRIDHGCRQMLRHYVEELGLSARGHDKILRVARTITDVAGDPQISEMHLAEAISYRSLDRDLWI
jgi:magnesium chelatase family protein